MPATALTIRPDAAPKGAMSVRVSVKAKARLPKASGNGLA